MRTTKIGSALVAGCILVGAALAQAGSGSSRRAGSGGRRAPRRVAATKAVEKGSPHAAFTALLAKHVQDGRVSYRGFQEDEAALDRYLGYFARTDPSGLSHKEQLAFWINAYNAFTIKLILQKYPDIKSIKDFWGPWDKRDWVVNGRKVTLNEIEHKTLRKMGEPRIHVAIVCASFSCPDLASEAYEADRLEEQLVAAMRRFLANPEKGLRAASEPGMVYGTNHVVRLSKIFSWFQEDFGRNPREVVRFLEPYMSEAQRSYVREHARELKVEYLDYGWQLNGA